MKPANIIHPFMDFFLQIVKGLFLAAGRRQCVRQPFLYTHPSAALVGTPRAATPTALWDISAKEGDSMWPHPKNCTDCIP